MLVCFLILFSFKNLFFYPNKSKQLSCCLIICKNPENTLNFFLSKNELKDFFSNDQNIKKIEFELKHEVQDLFYKNFYSFKADSIEFEKSDYNKTFYVSAILSFTILGLITYLLKNNLFFWITIFVFTSGGIGSFLLCDLSASQAIFLLLLPLEIVFCMLFNIIEYMLTVPCLIFNTSEKYKSFDSFNKLWNFNDNLIFNKCESNFTCINVKENISNNFPTNLIPHSDFKIIDKNLVEINYFQIFNFFYPDLVRKINRDVVFEIFNFLDSNEIIKILKVDSTNSKNIFYGILDAFFQAEINLNSNDDNQIKKINNQKRLFLNSIDHFFSKLKIE